MKSIAVLLLVAACLPAFAQPGPPAQSGANPSMPPPQRRMNWEERERLREEVRSGNMTREEARERWREQREKSGMEPSRRWEERQRLRRDVQDANRNLQKR